jgi:hypothetical protein
MSSQHRWAGSLAIDVWAEWFALISVRPFNWRPPGGVAPLAAAALWFVLVSLVSLDCVVSCRSTVDRSEHTGMAGSPRSPSVAKAGRSRALKPQVRSATTIRRGRSSVVLCGVWHISKENNDFSAGHAILGILGTSILSVIDFVR